MLKKACPVQAPTAGRARVKSVLAADMLQQLHLGYYNSIGEGAAALAAALPQLTEVTVVALIPWCTSGGRHQRSEPLMLARVSSLLGFPVLAEWAPGNGQFRDLAGPGERGCTQSRQ
jgi:hypothetical protein